MTIEQLLLFCGASFVLAFTPGPDIIYVLTRGVAQGRSAALAAAAGFSLGNIVHTTAAVVGVSALIASSALAFTIVKLAGATYLIYIGIRMFRAPATHFGTENKSNKAAWSVFRQSVLANILNPKVAVFFLAFFPQFVQTNGPNSTHPALQMAILGAVFIGVTFISFGTVAICSGFISKWLHTRPAAGGCINKVAGCVLVGLGLSLAVTDA